MAVNSNNGFSMRRPEHGYDVELVFGAAPDNKYLCPVCLNIMKDAMQTVCGHRFCKLCITKIIGERPCGKCPVDKTVLNKVEQLFNDVAVRREIMSLEIKCKNNGYNCLWTGELREFEKHLKECPREEVVCPLGCLLSMPRCDIDVHQDQCPQRCVECSYCKERVMFRRIQKHEVIDCLQYPVSCKLCGQEGIARGEIAHHIDSISGLCPEANIVCKFHVLGCNFQDKRKDMQKHYKENIDMHLSLMMGRIVELTITNETLKSELATTKGKCADFNFQIMEHVQTIRRLKDRTLSGRMLWKVDLNQLSPLPAMVMSPPFYSSCPGYQIRLRLEFRGVVDADTVYSSLFVVLQKGEFDDEILFPFNAQVKVMLVPQTNGRIPSGLSELSTIVVCCKDVPRNLAGNVNSRSNSRGRARFMKQKELLSPPFNKNNVMFFDVMFKSLHDNGSSLNPSSGVAVIS